jgi:hypothetical protein
MRISSGVEMYTIIYRRAKMCPKMANISQKDFEDTGLIMDMAVSDN